MVELSYYFYCYPAERSGQQGGESEVQGGGRSGVTWEGLDSGQRGGKLRRQMPERVPSEDRQWQSQPSQQIDGHSILVMSRLRSLGERTWRRPSEVPGEQNTMGRRDAPR